MHLLSIPYFFIQTISRIITRYPDSFFFQLSLYLHCILIKSFCNRNNSYLSWRHPKWKCTSKMFYKNSHSSLKRTRDCSMNYHWPFFLSFIIRKPKIKSHRKIKITLNSSKLPFSSDSIFKHKIKLRTIESSLSLYSFIWKFVFFCCRFKRTLSFFPNIIFS